MLAQGIGPDALPISTQVLPSAGGPEAARALPFLQEATPEGYSVTETPTVEGTGTETPVEAATGTPEPVSTDTPVPPPPVLDTETPVPSETPVPEETILPSETVEPTGTPTPTETLSPSQTPTEIVTPTPTETMTATPTSPDDIMVEGDDIEVDIPGNGAKLTAFGSKLKIHFAKEALPEGLKLHLRKLKDEELTSPLGGAPFEITAQGHKSQKKIKQFKKAIRFEFSYDPELFPGEEDNLRLFYYDEEEQAWMVLPGYVDTERHQIIAYSDHLTVFDFDIDTWDPTYLPSVKNVDVSGYTGGASYSMPIELPPLPGGMPFSLNLSYNSQAADEISNSTQAGIVGSGWTLDTGYVRKNFNGTADIREDDSLSLYLNGQSYTLWQDKNDNTIYHTEDETHLFIKRTVVNSVPHFNVIDQAGNHYNFDEDLYLSNRPVYSNPGPTEDCQYINSRYVWRWSMNEIKTAAGQTLTFHYSLPDKNTVMCNTSQPKMEYANYPLSIDYSDSSGTGR